MKYFLGIFCLLLNVENVCASNLTPDKFDALSKHAFSVMKGNTINDCQKKGLENVVKILQSLKQQKSCSIDSKGRTSGKKFKKKSTLPYKSSSKSFGSKNNRTNNKQFPSGIKKQNGSNPFANPNPRPKPRPIPNNNVALSDMPLDNLDDNAFNDVNQKQNGSNPFTNPKPRPKPRPSPNNNVALSDMPLDNLNDNAFNDVNQNPRPNTNKKSAQALPNGRPTPRPSIKPDMRCSGKALFDYGKGYRRMYQQFIDQKDDMRQSIDPDKSTTSLFNISLEMLNLAMLAKNESIQDSSIFIVQEFMNAYAPDMISYFPTKLHGMFEQVCDCLLNEKNHNITQKNIQAFLTGAGYLKKGK